MVCLGNRDHSAIFEILFLRYSTLLQLFPPFFLLTHLSIFCSFVSVILLLIPSSIFFLFQFLYCSLSVLYFFQVHAKDFFYLFKSVPPFYLSVPPVSFKVLKHFYNHYSEIFFRQTTYFLFICLVL